VTFSIVLPTYDRAPLLSRAIDSVLAQTDPDFELVVVDDGSTDDTERVVRAYADPRIRYLHQANAGVCAARNVGARAATGERLMFLDSDDELLPEALAKFRDAADANGWAVVLSGWIRVPAEGDRIPRVPGRDGPAPHLVGPYLAGAFVIERAVFEATGGYDEQLRFSENTVLGWRIRSVVVRTGATIGMIEEPLVLHHKRADRATARLRYDAAVHILDHYDELLRDPAIGAASARHRRANCQSIASANAESLGLRREALRYSLAAVLTEPTSPARYRSLARAALASVRPSPASSSSKA
jgi:glycosyltransferase involved in cell wall biosynthesis